MPVAVTRTGRKTQALLDAGAAHVIAAAEEDLGARLGEIAGPEGVRVVFDPIGGPAFEPLTAAMAMARGGILIEYGALKRVIDRTFPFEQIVEAHRYLESNEQFGKILVTP